MRHFTVGILEGQHGAPERQLGAHEGQHGAYEGQHGAHKRQHGAAPCFTLLDETLVLETSTSYMITGKFRNVLSTYILIALLATFYSIPQVSC